MAIKIVVDSSADMMDFEGADFAYAPLKIITADKEYVDNKDLDIDKMVSELYTYNGKSSTACPAPADWLDAFGDANEVFCITITSGLSGSYNSACVAKTQYENENENKKVFVIDSLSAGPELKLIATKLKEYINDGLEFDTICEKIKEYQSKTGLLFMLESMRNLANNGRVNPLVAKAAGLLGIRAVGRASDIGTLELLEKCRGEKKALCALVNNLKKAKASGKVFIAHCQAEGTAKVLADMIRAEFNDIKIDIYPCRALCSFYAERGGLLLGYEKA